MTGGLSVPNSIFLSNDINFHIITGPNMSGKTTFLKQIGLLQILAQIGSFVPAQMDTTFRLCDKIFTRMALNDNLQMNSSSFMVEIKELHYILNVSVSILFFPFVILSYSDHLLHFHSAMNKKKSIYKAHFTQLFNTDRRTWS